MKKRILAVILTLAMCLGLTGTALAVTQENADVPYPVTGGNIYLSYSEGDEEAGDPAGYWVSSCDDTVTEVVIPASVDGKPVVGIYIYTFQARSSLTSVTVPASVTAIGAYAFSECPNLKTATLLANVSYIDDCAFYGCTNLESVTIPNSVKTIYSEAFEACTSLKDVYFAGSEADWKSITIEDANEALNSAVIHYNASSGTPSTPPTPTTPTAPAPKSAAPTSAAVLVNGAQKSFDAYSIDGNNYFKLRDLAYVLSGTEKQFEVGWDAGANSIELTSGQPYTAVGGEMTAGNAQVKNAVPSAAKLLLNGEEVSLTAYSIAGNNYFKLRDIGELIDFGIGWDAASRTITIETSTGYTA